MKHRPKNRQHQRKSKQRAIRELEKAEEGLSCWDPYNPIAGGEEPSLEDMMDAGEGNLPDR